MSPAKARVIIEGVTGTGKSSLIGALRAGGICNESCEVVPEEETLGELMSQELVDPGFAPEAKLWRLHRVLQRVRAGADRGFVLERFHPTYYALLSDWSLYDTIDKTLAQEGFRLVVLTLPESAMRDRCLFRADRLGTTWTTGMIEHYGSASDALAAISNSQAKRIDLLERTSLAALTIDTSEMAWATYADRVSRVFE